MGFKYQSSEEVVTGDRIVYAGEPGEVEFLADPQKDADSWHVTEHGGGVAIRTLKHSYFLREPEDEDLEFVGRGEVEG